MDHILAVRGVSLQFGGVRALSDVDFDVREGELFSIIGPNGAGKTSMVNCISGRYRPSEGKLIYRGRDITPLNPNARAALGIGRTFQNLALFHHMSVLDNIMVGRHHLLKNNFLTGSLYWLTGARREELAHQLAKLDVVVDQQDRAGRLGRSRGVRHRDVLLHRAEGPRLVHGRAHGRRRTCILHLHRAGLIHSGRRVTRRLGSLSVPPDV